jgi:hypothetical protein
MGTFAMALIAGFGIGINDPAVRDTSSMITLFAFIDQIGKGLSIGVDLHYQESGRDEITLVDVVNRVA